MLETNEYNAYYSNYINLAQGTELLGGLENSFEKTLALFESITEDKLSYRYADGKWTIKEIIQHLIDTERVFCYRALCFARKDKVELPGFNQDEYLESSEVSSRSKINLIEEYKAVRMATNALFSSFTNEMIIQRGVASNSPLSVRAAGYIIIGHETHHCNIINQRYL